MTTRSRFLQYGAGALGAGALAGSPLVANARRKGLQDADVTKLYEAAKKEGTVVWWTGHYAQDAAERVRDAFKAKYPGIEVVFIRQTGQVIFQRLSQNLKSGIKEVDVFASTDEAHYPVLKKMNALATFVPEDIDKIAPAYRQLDPDETYQLGAYALMLFNYNPKKTSAPKRWNDLLDPKYKNQLTVGHPAFSGFVGNWVLAMTDKYGWDNYFKKFAANNPKIGRSVFDATNDIVGGERTVGPGADSLAAERHAAGNAIDIAFPEDDTIVVINPVAVMREAPHPNAARLFMNFYYSREYSQALLKSFVIPLRTDVPAAGNVHFDRLKLYRTKVDRLSTGIPEVVAKWRETFGV
ncbi:MAG: extracellular solute-binding protein [Vulcanimicrobiaceae bacterium]